MSSVCPSHDDLAAYAIGKLPRERCEEIDMHLVECDVCQAELETCGNADDTFLSRLRDPESEEEFLVDVECADLLDLVAAIGREPSFTMQRQRDDALDDATDLGEIGPYRLLARLGTGGMGTVYKAFHTKLERVVALKMLPTDRMQDEQAITRFEREMKAVGKLDHLNIVRATDAGEYEGKHFLVMENVEGTDLSHLVRRRGPLPVAEACEIIRQAAVGLQHAYEHGLVHRDIKPSNLMLTPDGTVKILDLGLALLPDADDGDRELTSTGQAMGTLDYMAPEQGGDSHEVDIRADIYSLGATLYKLLTGQAIFSGARYRTNLQKWKALTLEEAPPLQSRCEGIPDQLAAVVHRMLARDVDDRYATPQEVVDAVLPFCAEADLSAVIADEAGLSDEAVSASTSSFRKEAASLDTSSRPRPSKDIAPTQPLISKPAARGARRIGRPAFIALGLFGVAFVAAMVLFFQTPHGTLRVEISDPDIEVNVKGEDIVLTNADSEPIKLRAGEHTLIVTRGDDFTFETKQLILKKGETTTVKVELLPDKVQVVSAGTLIGEHKQKLAHSTNEGSNYALKFDGSIYEEDHVAILLEKAAVQLPLTVESFVYLDDSFGFDNYKSVWSLSTEPSLKLSAERENSHEWNISGWLRDDERFAYARENALQAGVYHVAFVWPKEGRPQMFVGGRRAPLRGGEVFEGISKSTGMFLIGGERGAKGGLGELFIGRIDELRISTVPRYKNDFTPPKATERFTPDEHTLALYHFDEGQGDVLHDSSGNGHHGKIVGAKWVLVGDKTKTTKAQIAQEIENALNFDGKSGKVDIKTLKYDGSYPLTLEAYVTPTGTRNSNVNIVGDHLDGGIMLAIDKERHWHFVIGAGAKITRVLSPEPIQVGQRVHVAGSWDHQRARLFINGREVASAPASPDDYVPSPEYSSFAIGAYKSWGGYFNGTIDQVRVSKTARYDAAFTPKVRFEADGDTFALYHFDAGSGDVLRDSSGNNHHGKIVGAKWVRVDGNEDAPSSGSDTLGGDPMMGTMGAPILAEPVQYEPTEALSHYALVPYPERVKGVKSWTVDTRFFRGPPRCLRFSPDGKLLAFLADGAVRIHDGESYEPVRTIMCPQAIEIAWLADSKTISAASFDAEDKTTIWLWDAADGKLVNRFDMPQTASGLDHNEKTRRMAWSLDDRLALAAPHVELIAIYDLKKKQIVQELAGYGSVGNVAWSPDGKRLAVTPWGMTKPRIQLWDMETYELLWEGIGSTDPTDTSPNGTSSAPLWSPDGTMLLVGYWKGRIVAWEATSGDRKWQVNGSGEDFAHLIHSSDPRAFVSAAGNVSLRDFETGEVIRQLSDGRANGSVACHPSSGRILLSSPYDQTAVSAVNLDGSGSSSHAFKPARQREKTAYTSAISWSDNIQRPVTVGGHWQGTREPRELKMVATPDGKYSAWASHWGKTPFTVRQGQRVLEIRDASREDFQVRHLAFQDDGSSIAALCRDGVVRVWELPGGSFIGELQNPLSSGNPFKHFGITKDRRITCLDEDGNLKISGPNLEPIWSTFKVTRGTNADLSPNSQQLALYTTRGLQLLDLDRLEFSPLMRVPPRFNRGGSGRFVKWRNDRVLALVDDEQRVILFDFQEEKVLRTYPFPWITHSNEFAGGAEDIVFGESGRYFVSWRWGHDARLLDTTNGCVESIVRFDNGDYLHVGMTGHWDASEKIADNVIYVVELENGDQLNLTPAEFEERFGWKNDPSKVQLTGSMSSSLKPAGISIHDSKTNDSISPTALVSVPPKLSGLKSWTLETKGERDVIKQIVSLPDSKRFATLDEHGVIRVRAADDGALQNVYVASPESEQLLYLSDDEALLAVSDTGDVHRWQLADNRHTIANWEGAAISGASVAPDGKRLAAWLDDQTAGIFDAASGEQTTSLKTGPRRDSVFDWSADGGRIASGYGIWDATTGEKIRSLDVQAPAGRHPRFAAWSPEGRQVVTWTASGYRWDAETGELLGNPSGLSIRLIRFSPDGRYLAAGGGFVTSVSDIKHDRHLSGQRGEHHVSTFAWSPDSKQLLIGDEEGNLTCWSRETYRDIYALQGDTDTIKEIEISSAGHYDAVKEAASCLVYVAETSDGRQLTFTPAEFEDAYGWKNSPEKIAD